jgi:PAS domain S-box-containing protein
VEQLVSTAKDIQLFSHNYVFTDNPVYLQEMDSAVSKANTRLNILQVLVQDNLTQTQLADSLSFYIKQRISFSRRIIESRLKGEGAKAYEIIATGQGIDLMYKLVMIVRQMREAELQLLKQRQERNALQLGQFNLLYKITIGVILAMTVLTVLITVYNSRLEHKIKAQVRQVSMLNAHLEKSERRFKGLIENGFDVISLLNKEIKPIYRSPAAERITGWSNEERTKIVGPEKTHPDDMEHFKDTVRKVLENPGKLFEITVRTQHKDGHYIWLEGILKNMLHDDSLQGIVSNFRDVTERKKIENQRALYESIIQYSEDAIVSKSTDGIIITWNRGAESLFGYKEEEVIGKNFSIFIPEDLIDEEKEIINKVQSGIPVENFETERITKTGKRINVSLTASPLIDIHGKMVGTSQIARDITERKNAEEKIHRLNIELEHKVILRTNELAQVNRELEAVSSYISRGVQAPLQNIKKNTLDLQQDLRNENNKTGLLEFIGSKTDEALKLIDELIQFSEISQRKLKNTYVDMNQLMEEVQQDLPVDIHKKIITLNKLHPLIGDPDLLRKLFTIIIGIRYVADPGSDASAIEIRSELYPEHVIYSIYDPGSVVYDSILNTTLFKDGIDREKEFDQDFVSLLIVRHIVLKHKGELRTQVLNSSGSSVTLSFPVNKLNKS